MSITSYFKGIFSAAALAAGAIVVGLAPAPAQALILTAADAICTSPENGGNDTVFLAGCGIAGVDLLYKANRDDGEEVTPFKDAYTTTFVPTTEADITWDGPDIISCPTCYLIAKDGNSDPNWFLFDLGALGWDGMETISIGPIFFKGTVNQDFSHVSIWGDDDCVPGPGVTCLPDRDVPEPGTLALVGLALVGVGAARRVRRS